MTIFGKSMTMIDYFIGYFKRISNNIRVARKIEVHEKGNKLIVFCGGPEDLQITLKYNENCGSKPYSKKWLADQLQEIVDAFKKEKFGGNDSF